MIKKIGIALLFTLCIVGSAFAINYVFKDWKIKQTMEEAVNDIDNYNLKQKNQATEQPKIVLDLSKTQPKLEFVTSTEYFVNDVNGSTIVKLTDYANNKIDTTCYEQILYPNKSIYIDWSLMTYQSEWGNYFYDFNVPDIQGNYDQEIRCLVSGKNISIGKGFHVNSFSETALRQNITDSLRSDRMETYS